MRLPPAIRGPHAWPLLLLLLAGLLACAASPQKAAPPAPASTANSPLAASVPQEKDSTRICLWILWSNTPTLIKEAQQRLREGKPFMAVALDTVRNNPGFATTNADCLPVDKLPQDVLKAVSALKLGQVSQPFALSGGTALAMRTSDRFRRRAKEFYDQKKYAQAMEALRLDLELHPAASNSWHLLALCLAATGKKEEALEAFDKALEWDPGDPAILNDKAFVLQEMKRPQESLVSYQKALAQEPQNPVYLNNLAWALLQQKKDLNRALALAKKATRLAPDNPGTWDTLGQVQQAMGRHAEAVVSFHRAIQLKPDYPKAAGRLLDSMVRLKPEQVARLKAKGIMPPPQAQAASTQAASPAPMPKPEPRPAPKPVPKPTTTASAEAQKTEPPVPKVQAKADQPEPIKPPAAKAEPTASGQATTKADSPDKLKSGGQEKPAQAEKPPPQKAAPKAQDKPKAKAKPDAQPPSKPPPASFPAGYYLQTASYKTRRLAEREGAHWKRNGQPSLVRAWVSPKQGTWYRVLLGPFPSRFDARQVGNQLKQQREIRSYVLIKNP